MLEWDVIYTLVDERCINVVSKCIIGDQGRGAGSWMHKNHYKILGFSEIFSDYMCLYPPVFF